MTLTLVYDGGCPFCRSFALRSELVGGIKELEIRDGRADNELRSRLQQQGYRLADGGDAVGGRHDLARKRSHCRTVPTHATE